MHQSTAFRRREKMQGKTQTNEEMQDPIVQRYETNTKKQYYVKKLQYEFACHCISEAPKRKK